MMHLLLIVFFAWWALNILRSLVRGKPTEDPTCGGRIVPRGYTLDIKAMAAENTARWHAREAESARRYALEGAAYQREMARTPEERDRRRRVFGIGA